MPDHDTTGKISAAIRVANALDNLNDGPEESHIEAEQIIVAYLRETGQSWVADAFIRAKKRCGFWYA